MSPAIDQAGDATIDELQHMLQAHKAELRRALERLEGRARAQLDFGRIVADHAEALLLGTAAVGLWLGLRRRRYPGAPRA